MSTTLLIAMPHGLSAPSANVYTPLALSSPIAVSLTESARDGIYSGTATIPANGWYQVDKFEGSALIGTSWIKAETSGTFADDDVRALDMSDDIAAIKAKTDLITRVTFLISGTTVDSEGTMLIKAGDRHEITVTSNVEDIVPDLTGVTIRFGAKTTSGTVLAETTSVAVLVATGFQSVKVTLLPAETILIPAGAGFYDVQAEYSSTDIRTFLTGSFSVKPDYSGVA